jgi:hypothetical protein
MNDVVLKDPNPNAHEDSYRNKICTRLQSFIMDSYMFESFIWRDNSPGSDEASYRSKIRGISKY